MVLPSMTECRGGQASVSTVACIAPHIQAPCGVCWRAASIGAGQQHFMAGFIAAGACLVRCQQLLPLCHGVAGRRPACPIATIGCAHAT